MDNKLINKLPEGDRKFLEEAADILGTTPDKCSVHITRVPEPCDHDWDNDGCNPEYCLKCGMSFMRHIFTEMP